MTYKPISARALSIWLLIAGFEGLVALFFVVREPSEPESALVFGLSLQRLLIALGVLFFASFFLVVAIAHFNRSLSWNESLNKRPERIRYLLAGCLVLAWIVVHFAFLLPEYHFPTLLGYITPLKPVLIWLAFLFAQTFVFLAYHTDLTLESLKGWRGMRPALLVLTTIALIWALIALTGIGIIPDDIFWNVAGVPLLAAQVWMAIGVILIAWFLHDRLRAWNRPQVFPLTTFIMIWIVAAVIWINTPLGSTFNAPGPYPPSRGFYPFVDAALFDLGAQSAIYGKGLFYGAFIDRALLSGFLALLHMMFGQNYHMVVGAQSAVYAMFPALLYLLGEKLHSKPVGLMAATLAIFKVSNAITGGRWISTSHPKLMLTEFPTGIVLVLITLFLVQWLRDGRSRAQTLAGVGASIGVGVLLRHNVLFMFPVFLIGGLVVWKLRWKPALRDIFIVALAFFVTISPWMWRSYRVGGEPIFFLPHFDRVIEDRYQSQEDDEQDRLVSSPSQRALRTSPVVSEAEKNLFLDLDQYRFIPKHFVHNIVTSALVLPPSPVLHDFRHVVDSYPYWDRIVNASLDDISFSTGIFLAANLIILSIGIGTAWKRVKFAALVPLVVFLFYNLSSAFARTSGGRYIVPVDWVVYFYYAIGLVEIVRFCIAAIGFRANGFFGKAVDPAPVRGNAGLDWRKAGLAILPFFLIVAALPLLELASPGEGLPETRDSLLEQLEEISFFEETGISRQQLEGFLEHPDALLLSGRGFYPRHYPYDQGEPILPGQMSVYTAREYPRLVFTLLQPAGERPVLLPIEQRNFNFPDAAEVIVAGCAVGQSTTLPSYLNYIDAAFVAIVDETKTVHVRVPEAPLACPLREPVCDNNHNCK